MSINVKKYTKDQMAKIVEEAAERLKSQEKENEELAEQLKSQTAKTIALRNYLMAKMHSNAVLAEKLDQMNGEAINKTNEIANLKANADALRNKLADTEAALGRANAETTYSATEKNELNAKIKQLEGERHYYKSRSDELDHYKNLLRNANEECARIRADLEKTRCDLEDWEQRSVWQFNHPWRNLWSWVKRKVKRHE